MKQFNNTSIRFTIDESLKKINLALIAPEKQEKAEATLRKILLPKGKRSSVTFA